MKTRSRKEELPTEITSLCQSAPKRLIDCILHNYYLWKFLFIWKQSEAARSRCAQISTIVQTYYIQRCRARFFMLATTPTSQPPWHAAARRGAARLVAAGTPLSREYIPHTYHMYMWIYIKQIRLDKQSESHRSHYNRHLSILIIAGEPRSFGIVMKMIGLLHLLIKLWPWSSFFFLRRSFVFILFDLILLLCVFVLYTILTGTMRWPMSN